MLKKGREKSKKIKKIKMGKIKIFFMKKVKKKFLIKISFENIKLFFLFKNYFFVKNIFPEICKEYFP